MDYRKVIEYHKEKNADITVVCKEMCDRDLTMFGIMKLDENNRISEFEEKPIEPQTNIASLGIYIISRTLLIDLLNEIIPEGRFGSAEEAAGLLMDLALHHPYLTGQVVTMDGGWL